MVRAHSLGLGALLVCTACEEAAPTGSERPDASEPRASTLDASVDMHDGGRPPASRDHDAGSAMDVAAPWVCGVVDGSKTITDAEDVRALAGCTGLTGNLTIQMTGLSDLHGLESLATVGGDVYVQGNLTLLTLEGLGGLTRVAGDLHITDNPTLADLTGLSGLRSVAGNLIIRTNQALPVASIVQLKHQIAIGFVEHCDNADDRSCCEGSCSS